MFVEIGDIVLYGGLTDGKAIPAIVTEVHDQQTVDLSALSYGSWLLYASVPLDVGGTEDIPPGTWRHKGGRAYGMGADKPLSGGGVSQSNEADTADNNSD